eukprot:755320-Hanusia_phi.AAC.3
MLEGNRGEKKEKRGARKRVEDLWTDLRFDRAQAEEERRAEEKAQREQYILWVQNVGKAIFIFYPNGYDFPFQDSSIIPRGRRGVLRIPSIRFSPSPDSQSETILVCGTGRVFAR